MKQGNTHNSCSWVPCIIASKLRLIIANQDWGGVKLFGLG